MSLHGDRHTAGATALNGHG